MLQFSLEPVEQAEAQMARCSVCLSLINGAVISYLTNSLRPVWIGSGEGRLGQLVESPSDYFLKACFSAQTLWQWAQVICSSATLLFFFSNVEKMFFSVAISCLYCPSDVSCWCISVNDPIQFLNWKDTVYETEMALPCIPTLHKALALSIISIFVNLIHKINLITTLSFSSFSSFMFPVGGGLGPPQGESSFQQQHN